MDWQSITRKELHRLVWKKPASQLKEKFGISDVAIAKACRRLEIPKPPRGYWARLAAGQKVKKTPLPKMSDELRRKLAQDRILAKQSNRSEPYQTFERLNRIELPKNNRKLHPVARELRSELDLSLPDKYEENRLNINDRKDLPRTTVSKAMIQTTVWIFHAITTTLEARNVLFKKARSKYDSAAFYYGDDRVCLSIEEPMISVTRQPTEYEKRRPSWEWSLHSRRASGHLTFTLDEGQRYSNRSHKIKQSAKSDLEAIAADVVESIWGYFVKEQESRVEGKARRERESAEYEKRRQREAISDHKNKLESIAQQRQQNLFWAAQWWNIENITADFIQACEDHWRSEQDELSDEKLDWLKWARALVESSPTASFSYPDPLTDGSFDPESVEQGGPYPATRSIPRPPSIPAQSSPPQKTDTYSQHRTPSEKPYPFWLKHQR